MPRPGPNDDAPSFFPTLATAHQQPQLVIIAAISAREAKAPNWAGRIVAARNDTPNKPA